MARHIPRVRDEYIRDTNDECHSHSSLTRPDSPNVCDIRYSLANGHECKPLPHSGSPRNGATNATGRPRARAAGSPCTRRELRALSHFLPPQDKCGTSLVGVAFVLGLARGRTGTWRTGITERSHSTRKKSQKTLARSPARGPVGEDMLHPGSPRANGHTSSEIDEKQKGLKNRRGRASFFWHSS